MELILERLYLGLISELRRQKYAITKGTNAMETETRRFANLTALNNDE